MSELHPIVPGMWCVPTAIYAITGRDINSVIYPALNRHGHASDLTEIVVDSTASAAVATLQELGYRVARYNKPEKRQRTVATWAARSAADYPGRVLMAFVTRHVVVIKDGRVYDNWSPHGPSGEAHPYAKAVVESVFLVTKMT